jgi:hypothetical protein
VGEIFTQAFRIIGGFALLTRLGKQQPASFGKTAALAADADHINELYQIKRIDLIECLFKAQSPLYVFEPDQISGR